MVLLEAVTSIQGWGKNSRLLQESNHFLKKSGPSPQMHCKPALHKKKEM